MHACCLDLIVYVNSVALYVFACCVPYLVLFLCYRLLLAMFGFVEFVWVVLDVIWVL